MTLEYAVNGVVAKDYDDVVRDTSRVMSEESATPDPVILTRELAEAQGVDATMRFIGPGSVYDMSRLGLPAFEGSAAIRSFLEDWYGSYQAADDELRETRDLGNGIVFVAVRETARPSGSPATAQVHAVYGLVLEWTQGKAARVIAYPDIDDARAAAERLAEDRG